jgi:hypothetical protein
VAGDLEELKRRMDELSASVEQLLARQQEQPPPPPADPGQ